jgi:type II secretory pathway predicted ATPase ExeA
MYEDFFGLNEKPFSLLPDPDFLFLSSKHSLALNMLEYSLAGQAGFCAITGEIGSGKTTLIRALLRRMDRDIRLGLISNTHSSLTDIASWALSAFGRSPAGKSRAEIHQDLMLFLIEEYGAGKRSVLIVDEAQNLTIEALEELRLLSNINADKDLLLQIILVGQPELLEKLRRPELCQFAQRISVSYHLAPLTCAETLHYITHRLRVAGTTAPIFNDMAVGGIQYFSGGVPRLINSICDMAMVYAYADQVREVDLDHIFRVVGDRMSNGVSVFAGIGGPEDPVAVREITGLIRAAGEARATLPAPAVPEQEPAPEPAATRRRQLVANDLGNGYSSLAAQQAETRPSWFRRTFLRAN